MRQKPRETLRAFISRFTKVRGTIPHISDAFIITAFRQGVRDEKMLEKLATQEVESVTMLFSLADKCARAAEGRAWHSAPQDGDAKTGGSRATAQGGGKKKKNKNRGRGEPHPGGPVAAATTPAAAAAAGARIRMASTRARKVETEVHAQFIPPLATAPLTAMRSRNSRSGSLGGVSRPPRTAHPLLASGLSRRKPPTARPLPGRRSWGTNPPLGS